MSIEILIVVNMGRNQEAIKNNREKYILQNRIVEKLSKLKHNLETLKEEL